MSHRILEVLAWASLTLFPIGDALGYEPAPAAVSLAAFFGIAATLVKTHKETP